MVTLYTNIKSLVSTRKSQCLLKGNQLRELPCIENAFLLIEDGVIAAYDAMSNLSNTLPQLPKNIVDVSGQFVLPTWCDSHTHLVFAGTRENEFIDKINGLSYAEIAARGGGILHLSLIHI